MRQRIGGESGKIREPNLLIAIQETIRVNYDEGRRPIGTDKIVGIIRKSFCALFPFSDYSSSPGPFSRTYKIPAIVVDRGNLGQEVYTTLTLDNVMIAKTLVPRYIFEDPLAVHVDPGFLEAENAAGGKVDAGIIEIVAHGNLREC
jgi:hypothetical protein